MYVCAKLSPQNETLNLTDILRSTNVEVYYIHVLVLFQALVIALLCLVDLHFTFRQMYGEDCSDMEIVPTAGQVSLGIKIATYVRV